MGFSTIPLKKVLKLERDNGNGHMIGLSSYPIPSGWSEDDRTALNIKIIHHFYNREIGMETISLFVFAMSRKMNEVMPYWAKIYESAMLEFDPLATYNITTVREGNAREIGRQDSETDGNSSVSSGSRAINSDFPQSILQGSSDYASSGADNNGTTSSTAKTVVGGNSDTNTTQSDSSTTKGYQGNPSDMLTRYRATILNIDMLVIADLEECFSQLWGHPDNYAQSDYGMLPMLRRGYYY